MRRSGPGSRQRVRGGCMQGGHCAHAQVGKVLQLGQVGQLQVQRVHNGPPVDRDDADD